MIATKPIAAHDTPEWHAIRSRGIGASEAAAACGLSRWELPLEVWSRKVNGDQKDETDAMLLGTLMEPVVCQFFVRKTGREILQASPGLYRHPDVEFMLASPDALLADGTLAEFKTTTSRNGDLGEEGTDDVPLEWLCQAQQQMACTGAPAVRFGVLIDGREFREYVVERHSTLIDRLIVRESELWQHVLDKTPPPLDFSNTHAARAARDAFRTVTLGTEIALDASAEVLADQYTELGKQARQAEQAREAIKAQLLMQMGDAETGRLPSGGLLKRTAIAETNVPAHTRKAHVKLYHRKAE